MAHDEGGADSDGRRRSIKQADFKMAAPRDSVSALASRSRLTKAFGQVLQAKKTSSQLPGDLLNPVSPVASEGMGMLSGGSFAAAAQLVSGSSPATAQRQSGWKGLKGAAAKQRLAALAGQKGASTSRALATVRSDPPEEAAEGRVEVVAGSNVGNVVRQLQHLRQQAQEREQGGALGGGFAGLVGFAGSSVAVGGPGQKAVAGGGVGRAKLQSIMANALLKRQEEQATQGVAPLLTSARRSFAKAPKGKTAEEEDAELLSMLGELKQDFVQFVWDVERVVTTLFNNADTDADGYITVSQLKAVFQAAQGALGASLASEAESMVSEEELELGRVMSRERFIEIFVLVTIKVNLSPQLLGRVNLTWRNYNASASRLGRDSQGGIDERHVSASPRGSILSVGSAGNPAQERLTQRALQALQTPKAVPNGFQRQVSRPSVTSKTSGVSSRPSVNGAGADEVQSTPIQRLRTLFLSNA
eukprot:TRINITY_DN5361_c0_g2_i2.p1 TRINITY_DN5361_c0_g2~~TRINITY_DN5361_c0_g2_i2.p1  ORF type:complete len:474 (+),score=99.85 TRINITY_DN5361_c0_g2_i2:48-1469(+)